MPATSGSPTQISTSAATAADLAGTPDDQFKNGDLAVVVALMPNGIFRLDRTITPPADNVNVIDTFTGNGSWILLAASMEAPWAAMYREAVEDDLGATGAAVDIANWTAAEEQAIPTPRITADILAGTFTILDGGRYELEFTGSLALSAGDASPVEVQVRVLNATTNLVIPGSVLELVNQASDGQGSTIAIVTPPQTVGAGAVVKPQITVGVEGATTETRIRYGTIRIRRVYSA